MLTVQDGQYEDLNLIIRYGTTDGDHEAYSSLFVHNTGTKTGAWSTQDSNSTSRTQSTLFTIDGKNYAIDLEQPEHRHHIHNGARR